MIFPKDQQSIESLMNQELKQEALELIISMYLERVKEQDIIFLHDNFGTTQALAMGIRTHLSEGLTYEAIESNRLQYGENTKLESPRHFSILRLIKTEILTVYFIFLTILFLTVETYGQYSGEYIHREGIEVLYLMNSLAIFIRILVEFIFGRKFVSHSLLKDKNNLYQVYRNGNLLQISEQQLVVGDIIQLGFKQKVPASGIIVSGKEIFVKEGKGQTVIQNKMKLQDCMIKLKNMTSLDLKLCYQEKNLPSPVIIRGSQLSHGSTFKLMVLSVTEQNLLQQHQLCEEDNFNFEKYEVWLYGLLKQWQKKSFIAILLLTIIIVFAGIINKDMVINQQKITFEVFAQILTEIAAWFVILNSANIRAFLQIYKLSLLAEVQMPENWSQYVCVERIICDEKNIVKNDIIRILKYAVCQKMDLVDSLENGELNPLTVDTISETQRVFDLQGSLNLKQQQELDQKNFSKFVIVNKKKTKIISCPTSKNANSNIMKRVYNQIAKVTEKQPQVVNNREPSLSLKYKKNENEKTGSHKHMPSSKEDLQNLNQIINTQCQVKSRGILAGIVEIAEKGCKTYYYQLYESQRMEEITHVINNGILNPASEQDRERMKMLARKIALVYDLIPVMLGFHEGSYSHKPLQVLVCIIGVSISQNNKILQTFKQLQLVGIKSLVIISKNWNDDDEQLNQQQICEQYTERKWIENRCKNVNDIQKIKSKCGRLVCCNCLIANCDCKNKIQEISNVQQFLSDADSLKLIYNLDESGVSFLQKIYSQLQYNLISITSPKISALDMIQSIKNCLFFVEGICRSLFLWYLLSLLYFVNPILFWVRELDVLTVRQIGFTFGILMIWLILTLVTKLKISVQSVRNFNRKKICLFHQKEMVLTLIILALSIIFTQLLFSFSYLIPQESDRYDLIMQEHSLPRSCKYHGNQMTISNTASIQNCSFQITNLIYSKISTILVIYLYYVFWLTVVIKHRNIRSFSCIILYSLFFFVGIAMIKWIPEEVGLYPYGITIIQILILAFSVFLTVLIGFIGTQIISISDLLKDSFFEQQLESSIDFGIQKKSHHYSSALKRYRQELLFRKQI